MFKKRGGALAAIIILALLSALILVAFAGCGSLKDLGKPGADAGAKSVTVIVGDSTFSVQNTSAEFVHDLLVQLKDEGKLIYEFHDSEYGAYIDELGSLKAGANSYVSVYHNIDDLALYDPAWDAPIQRDGTTFHSSSLGVGSLPVKDGASYLFVLLTF